MWHRQASTTACLPEGEVGGAQTQLQLHQAMIFPMNSRCSCCPESNFKGCSGLWKGISQKSVVGWTRLKDPLVQLTTGSRLNLSWVSWVFQGLLQISKEGGVFSIVSKENNNQNINFE